MNRRDFTRTEAYAEAARALSDGPGWLADARGDAATTLTSGGFPGRDEAWKYTRASALLGESFTPVVGAPADVSLPPGPWDGVRIRVFVDGLSAAELPSERPARLGEALGDVEGFSALNLAFMRHGAVLRIGADESDKRPVHLVHVSTGAHRLGAVRHLVEVDPGAKVQLVEHFLTVGDGPALTTAATEVLLGAGAEVDHVRVLDEGADALHVGATAAVVGEGAHYRFSSVVLGASVARVEVRVRLDAPGAHTTLSGLSLLRGHQHVDHHVTVDHATPNCTSDQFFRAVLDDRSRSVYTGAVMVRDGALGTDSSQLHHALLLSDDAVVNARPWLEIFADDVRCAHGAAIGSLDADALFYLRQRGLTQHQARALLTAGFAKQILARLPEGRTRDALEHRATSWLESR